MEFFKWLTDDALEVILQVLNQCWEQEILPDDLEEANVVTLYKKGKVEDPANYRPISLLNSLYKIYASILEIRLADSIDNRISKNQYGFRRAKSTNQQLFIARRMQDIAEASGEQTLYRFLRLGKSI